MCVFLAPVITHFQCNLHPSTFSYISCCSADSFPYVDINNNNDSCKTTVAITVAVIELNGSDLVRLPLLFNSTTNRVHTGILCPVVLTLNQ